MRVYVGGFGAEWLASRAATAGVRVPQRFFRPVTAVVVDTAGWRGTRLRWEPWYYDDGGTAYVDVFARRVRGHTLAVVFMYSGGWEDALAERDLILGSFAVRR